MNLNTNALPFNSAAPSARPVTAVETVGWTVAGVTAMLLLGMAINAAGVAAGLPDRCWQLTGARAAGSTLVLGSMLSLRRGSLALFGALYGAWLLTMHSNLLLAGSAIAAGVGAAIVGTVLAGRGMILRMLGATLAFNVLITMSSVIKMLGSDAGTRFNLANWGSTVGLRALATVAIVGIFALISLKRSSPLSR